LRLAARDLRSRGKAAPLTDTAQGAHKFCLPETGRLKNEGRPDKPTQRLRRGSNKGQRRVCFCQIAGLPHCQQIPKWSAAVSPGPGGAEHRARNFRFTEGKAPPRQTAAGCRRQRSRGSHSTMWVAPSSAGCSSLTRRQRSQFGPNSGLCGAPHKPDYAKLSVMRSGVA
jgi:hypothetical protein